MKGSAQVAEIQGQEIHEKHALLSQIAANFTVGAWTVVEVAAPPACPSRLLTFAQVHEVPVGAHDPVILWPRQRH
jgi:hypothetical protein